MRCPYCDEEIHLGSKFCPHCGKILSEEDNLRCSKCNKPISKEEKVCPHCQHKINVIDKLPENERKGFINLLLVGLAGLFCLIPFLSLALSGSSIAMSYQLKEKSRYAKDAFILGIVLLGLEAIVFIINLVINLNSLLA